MSNHQRQQSPIRKILAILAGPSLLLNFIVSSPAAHATPLRPPPIGSNAQTVILPITDVIKEDGDDFRIYRLPDYEPSTGPHLSTARTLHDEPKLSLLATGGDGVEVEAASATVAGRQYVLTPIPGGGAHLLSIACTALPANATVNVHLSATFSDGSNVAAFNTMDTRTSDLDTSCKLTGADLTSTDLAGAEPTSAEPTGSELTGADLSLGSR